MPAQEPQQRDVPRVEIERGRGPPSASNGSRCPTPTSSGGPVTGDTPAVLLQDRTTRNIRRFVVDRNSTGSDNGGDRPMARNLTELDWPEVKYKGTDVRTDPRLSGLREVEPLFSRRPYEGWCRIYRKICEDGDGHLCGFSSFV
jgi:hypothetical protein